MVAVALVSAFITMRFAIHGREAVVPALTGLSAADAGRAAGHAGLNLTVENRFYSADVPAGQILAQDPPPGSRVRREWAVRVTQSLGPQRVSVPDLAGESERAATVSVRRLSLDLGVVARLALAGDADVVLAQTPQANSGGADSPRVSLLVSDPASAQPPAYVMPSLVGLTYSAAADRAAMAGLHLEVAQPGPPPRRSGRAANRHTTNRHTTNYSACRHRTQACAGRTGCSVPAASSAGSADDRHPSRQHHLGADATAGLPRGAGRRRAHRIGRLGRHAPAGASRAPAGFARTSSARAEELTAAAFADAARGGEPVS